MQKDLSFECNCPYCNAIIDALTSFNKIEVKHDDFTICSVCAGVCNWIVIDNKYSLRKSTEEDIDHAKEIGMYGDIEELIDFIKGKDSKIIRPSN